MAIRKTLLRFVVSTLRVIGVSLWVTWWLCIALFAFALGFSILLLPLVILDVRWSIVWLLGFVGGVIGLTPVVYLFARAIKANRLAAQHRVWLRANHKGYTRGEFIADLTERGLRREAVIAVYDYLARVWKPHEEWPIHPDDPLETVYGMVVYDEIVFSGLEADLPYRQPLDDEWDQIERLETVGDLTGLVSHFYVSEA